MPGGWTLYGQNSQGTKHKSDGLRRITGGQTPSSYRWGSPTCPPISHEPNPTLSAVTGSQGKGHTDHATGLRWALARGLGTRWVGVPRYLRSRHGELEPVCTSSNLSSLSAELRAQGGGAVSWPRKNPSTPSPCQGPSPPPSLLDNGVHGCNALGHDERLTVGHVIQGRSRVARQDDLQQTPRLLRDRGCCRAPSQTARPPAQGSR